MRKSVREGKPSSGNSPSSSHRTDFLPWGLPLLFCAAGQFFILHREIAWTLLPGLAFFAMGSFLFFNLIRKTRDRLAPFSKVPRSWETKIFLTLMSLAAFLRLYRIAD